MMTMSNDYISSKSQAKKCIKIELLVEFKSKNPYYLEEDYF